MRSKLGGESWRPNQKLIVEVVVLRQPGSEEEDWRVTCDGRITTPSFNSRGPADAYAAMLRRGQRQPEYPR